MFLISILFVLISSYFITSCIMKKEQTNNLGVIYFLLICFSQIILSFELLSLFSLISEKFFIMVNKIIFLSSLVFWIKSSKPIYKPKIFDELKNIIESLKQDKLLSFISICFIVFLISELFVALFFPITFGDTLKYTFTRCTSWIQNGNINHFVTPDTRELIMPVNLEFLYTWLFLFIKKENGTAIFSYISYLGAIYLIYNFLGELKFEINKRLWAIFAFSSFALIGVMAYSPCSDLLLGTLILSSTYLFYIYCKNGNKTAIYFASLAYAIAIGTKTTAIMMIPATSIIFLVFLIQFKKDIKKSFLLFSIPFLINFLIGCFILLRHRCHKPHRLTVCW